MEVTYLIEKARLPAITWQILSEALDDSSEPFVLAVLDRRVANALGSVPRNEIADLPDRIVAATAVAFRRTRASMVKTI